MDKGVYLIIGKLKENKEILIGRIGKIDFKKGYYLYVGRALKNLNKRIARHLRKKKKKRWHIDYFIPYLKDIKLVIIKTDKNLECDIAQELKNLVRSYIKGFGSSDCPCESHLFYFPIA